MNEWKEVRLGDVVEIKYGKDHKKLNIGTVPVYGSGGIMRYVDISIHNEKSVLIPRKGTLGNLFLVKPPFWTVDTLFWTDINTSSVDTDFLFYCLSTKKLEELNVGTAVPSLTTAILNEVLISLPPLETQKKIASVLSALDEKIELNNKINKDLEDMAQAIFDESFQNILFFKSSDTFETLIEFSNGKKRPIENGSVPVYGGNGILAYTNTSNAENCIIVGRVGAYCGNVFLSRIPCWVSDNAIIAKYKNSKHQYFAFYLLKKASLPTRHIGTSQPLMTQSILQSIPCNLPTKEQINIFNEKIHPIQYKIDVTLQENQHLSQLRDTLLPRLMSGEIDVGNVVVS